MNSKSHWVAIILSLLAGFAFGWLAATWRSPVWVTLLPPLAAMFILLHKRRASRRMVREKLCQRGSRNASKFTGQIAFYLAFLFLSTALGYAMMQRHAFNNVNAAQKLTQ